MIRYPVAVVRGVALMLAICCVVIAVTALPDVPARSVIVSVIAAALLWGERLNPIPWALAWWLGGVLSPDATHAALAIALSYRSLYRPAFARWPLVVAAVGTIAATATEDPTGIGRPRPVHADVVCLGDSSAAGFAISHPYCDLLGGQNFAVRGSTPHDTIAQWRSARWLKPRWVIVQTGPNGQTPDGAEMRESLATLGAEVSARGAQLVVIDYPVTLWPEPRWKRHLREAVPGGATLIDPRLRWWEIDGDHLHPTAAGHRRIAAAVAEVLVRPNVGVARERKAA